MKKVLFLLMIIITVILPIYGQNPVSSNNSTIPKYDSQNRPAGSIPNPEAGIPIGHDSSTATNQPVAVDKPDEKKELSPIFKFFNVLLSLAIVLIVAYIVMNILKKIYNGDIRLPGNMKIPESSVKHGLIRVVETASLGQGRTLYLITVEKRAFLVASSGQQFTLIGEFVDEEWQSNLTSNTSGTPAPIEAALSRILGNKEKRN
ncbi:MAG: flagellar biosynthetic protein FliO [bacterium]